MIFRIRWLPASGASVSVPLRTFCTSLAISTEKASMRREGSDKLMPLSLYCSVRE